MSTLRWYRVARGPFQGHPVGVPLALIEQLGLSEEEVQRQLEAGTGPLVAALPPGTPRPGVLAGQGWYAGEGPIGWAELDPQDDPRAVQQVEEVWCGAATGQMLLADRGIVVSQFDIVQRAGLTEAGIHDKGLAQALQMLDGTGRYEWQAGSPVLAGVHEEEALFHALSAYGSWGAIILTRGRFLHMVVVDGLDEQGRVIIRDPAQGKRYHIAFGEFFYEFWTLIAVWAVPR